MLSWWLLLCLAAALLVPRPATGQDGLAEDRRPAYHRGIEVYLQQYCGPCHRLDRAETGGTFGPSHNGYAAIAASRILAEDYTGHATTAAEYIRESIVDPNAHVVPGYGSGFLLMPAYGHLAPEDLEALVHLLLSEE